MPSTHEEYFKALNLPRPLLKQQTEGGKTDSPTEDGTTKQLTESGLYLALERAHKLRSFEIEHYWKRAGYFWGYQASIFIAFAAFMNNDKYKNYNIIIFALAVLGVLIAFVNLLSAKGSRFWQKNWEHHIDVLENQIEGKIHKIIWLTDGHRSYSVSRLNESLSYFLIIFWIILYINTIINEPSIAIIVTSVFVLIIGILYLFMQTTNFTSAKFGTCVASWENSSQSIAILSRFALKLDKGDDNSFIERHPGE